MTESKAEVRHEPSRSRYELLIDGQLVGIADYRLHDDVAVMPHTEIERARRNHGLGAILVQGALDDLRAKGKTVVPACWYVADFIAANPAYTDLVR